MRETMLRAALPILVIAALCAGQVAAQSVRGCATITDRELRGTCEASQQRYAACFQKKRGDPERARCEAAAFDLGSRTCNGMAPGRRGACLIATNEGRLIAGEVEAAAAERNADCAETVRARMRAEPSFLERGRSLLNGRSAHDYPGGMCRLLADIEGRP